MLLLRQRSASRVGHPFVAAVFSLLFEACVCGAQQTKEFRAQTAPGVFDFDKARPRYAVLVGLWRFHLGDDPDGGKGWARPEFDDSAWPLIRDDKGWNAQGFHDTDGMAWYRAKVNIPAGLPPLSLYVWDIRDSSQVFVDGHLIGSFGGMPPNGFANYRQLDRVYPLPQPTSLPNAARTITIGIRVWRWPHWAGYSDGGLDDYIKIGTMTEMQFQTQQFQAALGWSRVSDVLRIALELLAALCALSFFAMRRGEREYLWCGIFMLAGTCSNCLIFYGNFRPIGAMECELIANLLGGCKGFAIILFYSALLRARRDWLFWLAIAGITLNCLAQFPIAMGLGDVGTWNRLTFALWLPALIFEVTLLVRRAWQGVLDARLLFLPVILNLLVSECSVLAYICRLVKLQDRFFSWADFTFDTPFPMSILHITDAIFLLSLMAVFIHRFIRASRLQEQLAGELEAARVVQQVLVPEDIPAISGFTIQSVYKPFGQAGGDLFQILPTPSGGALVGIGDVSGKGMPAAMTVSLLVGAIRTLADSTQNPGEILKALNLRMMGRTNGGFTTCLALRADLDGTLTVANAGHISPYLDGQELKTENGLPLGLNAESSYAESTFQMAPNSRLTLVTDGVVEARSKTGELFGFERTAAIAMRQAESIAQSAQAFGQDDDITVLTLERDPEFAFAV
jgi:hypothetical protein